MVGGASTSAVLVEKTELSMNGYAVFILTALVLEFLVSVLADWLNLGAQTDEVPAEFRDVCNAAMYRRAQEYLRATTRFGLVSDVYGLGVLLLFWFSRGFGALDSLVRGWQLGPVQTGVAYVGIVVLGRALLGLPFRIYSTFVIEERFGFNRTTPWTFVQDLGKTLVLGMVLGGGVLAGVLAFFEHAGAFAWAYCWLAVTLFSLAVHFVAPVWIMPLFNAFRPLEDGELKSAILDFAAKVKFPLKGVYVVDGSRRSSKANAFFTGFGRNKRIALFDTLVANHPVPDLVAVLAHEIGHFKKRHVLKRLVIGILHTGALLYLLSWFLGCQGLFEAFHMSQTSVYGALVLFGLLLAPVEFVLSYAVQALSRRHEYQADRFAAEHTGDPERLCQALIRLSVQNLANLTPHPFYVALNYSHPPVLRRIRALRNVG